MESAAAVIGPPQLHTALAAAPPLEPDEPTGRDWVLQELSKPEYAQARPSPIDEFFNSIWEWVLDMLSASPDSPFTFNPLLLIVLILVIAAVLALVFFGRPRALARRGQAPGSVFLDDDDRSSAELRAAARAAADAGDWALATTERFRALSRALTDRTLIALRPGTTAQGVARDAERAFPDERAELHEGANAFDAVRYLGASGSRERYERLTALDERLERTKPTRIPVGAAK